MADRITIGRTKVRIGHRSVTQGCGIGVLLAFAAACQSSDNSSRGATSPEASLTSQTSATPATATAQASAAANATPRAPLRSELILQRSVAEDAERLSSCRECNTGSLSGVELCVWSDDCNFAIGDGGTFHASLHVDRSDPVTTPERCGVVPSDPLSLLFFEVTDDNGTYYCPCPIELCLATPSEVVTLPNGDFEQTFSWNGREYGSLGDATPLFLAGDYVVRVSFGTPQGMAEGEVSVELPIRVLDNGLGVTDACNAIETEHRDCSWQIAESAEQCTPGEVIALGCGGGCNLMSSSCEGEPVVRVCPGANNACKDEDALSSDWKNCNNACARSEFVCPDEGVVTVLTGAWFAGEFYECNVGLGFEEPPPAPMIELRSGFPAVTGADGRIYAVGGSVSQANTEDSFTSSEVFDPVANTWTTIAPLLTTRTAHTAAAAQDGRIFVFGGTGYDAQVLDSVEVYDPSMDQWATAAPMPTPRYSLSAVGAQDGKIYTFGGYDGDHPLDVVEVFDPVANSWASLAKMPAANSQMQPVLAQDGLIYAFTLGPNGEVGIYDPMSDSWTLGAGSLPRCAGAALAGDGTIFLIGSQNRDQGKVATAYDPPTNSFRALAPLGFQRAQGQAAADAMGRVYALGGGSTRAVEVYDVQTGIWH